MEVSSKGHSNVKKLVISSLVIAIYAVIMYFTQSFAFGQYQIRIATSLYALSSIFPFLILPLGIANLLSNTIMGGLGPLDMFGGAIVGIIASTAVYFIRRYKLNDWFMVVPIVLVPGLLVPVWLSVLIHLPYKALALSISIGQIIPAVVGVLLVKQLQKAVR